MYENRPGTCLETRYTSKYELPTYFTVLPFDEMVARIYEVISKLNWKSNLICLMTWIYDLQMSRLTVICPSWGGIVLLYVWLCFLWLYWLRASFFRKSILIKMSQNLDREFICLELDDMNRILWRIPPEYASSQQSLILNSRKSMSSLWSNCGDNQDKWWSVSKKVYNVFSVLEADLLLQETGCVCSDLL